MEHIYRLYVEKKPEHRQEARHLLKDLREHLNLPHLEDLRLLIRYDASGLTEEQYRKAVNLVFSEPPVDNTFEKDPPQEGSPAVIAWEYQPGQYDQRADSAEQALRIIDPSSSPRVRTAHTALLYGALTDDQLAAVRRYLINPVDSKETDLKPLTTLEAAYPPAADVPLISGLTTASDAELEKLYRSLGLAMSAEDFRHCRDYFRDEEKRDPSETEIRLLDTYWSDHCRHTTFLSPLDRVDIAEDKASAPLRAAWEELKESRKALSREEKPLHLMEIATAGMRLLKADGKLEDLEETDEINACSIVVPAGDEEWLVMFKNETHNHPTEIEPFGGAATCLGGAIRDPLSGRSYVYQAMRITGAGDPRQPVEETLPGKLPQRKICREAAHGYSSYGNQIGLATGLVREIYHPGYVAKRMEIGAVIAAVPRKNVRRGQAEPGDVIIVTGGRTGRDGCGGATGSSKEHTEESIAVCGAEVQKGNPPTERKLQRLFRNPEASRLIKVCNDFGAGGVSVAIGELADGLDIDLDKLPRKYEGLDGTELAISESQERMAVVVSPEDAERFRQLAAEENLEATQVAVVTAADKTGRVRMFWRGKPIVDLSRAFIDTNGVMTPRQAKAALPAEPVFPIVASAKDDLKAAVLETLGDLSVCSQKNLGEWFDSSIGAGTILMPYGGRTQTSPADVMAAYLPHSATEKERPETATLMSWGFHPEISEKSPFHGASWAVAESVARLVAAGANRADIRLTLQEYFERLGTDPEKWGKPLSALLGAFQAQKELGTAAIGGKDSMSGTFEQISVPPTLVSFSVAPLPSARIKSSEFRGPGNTLWYLPPARDAAGLPDYARLREQWDNLSALLADTEGTAKSILSLRVTEAGGLAAALFKSAFGNRIGFQLREEIIQNTSREDLLGLTPCGILLECEAGTELGRAGFIRIGETTETPLALFGNVDLDLEEAYRTWAAPLEDIFPPEENPEGNLPLKASQRKPPHVYIGESKTTRPRVIIPAFPGTNCEDDSARAFNRTGAVAQTLVFRNNSPQDIRDSINALATAIDNSQILMLPGGFSAGDEPDGSAKFITAVFRNPQLTEAVTRLLEERDGLVLGICNGFQALVKLGLVPFGRITEPKETNPTLTFNSVGRHISRMAETEIISNRSPWLQKCQIGDKHIIPISHGEGRFYALEKDLKKWNAQGQIATVYSGSNPNGSAGWVEGITSPDGRVLGKMGHSERTGAGLAVNIPGESDQKIFESGTFYFL